MSTKDVAEKAMHLGKQLKAVIEVGELLDEIGDLELYKAECYRDAEKAYEDKTKAVDELKDVTSKLDVAKSDLENSKSESKRIISEANQRSASCIAEARKEHNSIIDGAIKASDDKMDEARSEVVLLHGKRDALLKDVSDAQKAVTNLENQMKALKERLG